MGLVAATFDHVALGPETAFRNLTVFPLLGAAADAAYLTLDEAIERGLVRITEVSAAGSVPDLAVVNDGASPVLLVNGEELAGAKQNRVINVTILVAAHTQLTIPVSCVESGRWSVRSAAFSSTPRTHHATGRAMCLRTSMQSLEQTGVRRSDQAAVWRDIADKSDRLGSYSPTAASEAMHQRHGASIEEYVQAFTPAPGQVGAVFAINGRVAGVDLFDAPATFGRLMPKLLRSYALDAIDSGTADAPATPRAGAAEFLSAVTAAETKEFPAVGLGHDLRLATPALEGAALVDAERLVHLSAFSLA